MVIESSSLTLCCRDANFTTCLPAFKRRSSIAGSFTVPSPLNGKLKDELIDREIFYSFKEAQVLVEQWRREYNTVRPHSALGYRPPAPEAVRPVS
jgi:transposase InsO family protein